MSTAGEDSNVVRVAAAKPFLYRDLVVEKLKANKDAPVVLSGLGSAINTAVTVAELLKAKGICDIAAVSTSMFTATERMPRAQITITLKHAPTFNEAVAAKQSDTDEKKKIRDIIDAGRVNAHKKFREMTTQTPQ